MLYSTYHYTTRTTTHAKARAQVISASLQGARPSECHASQHETYLLLVAALLRLQSLGLPPGSVLGLPQQLPLVHQPAPAMTSTQLV